MRVLLDNEPLSVEPATLDRALAVAREMSEARGRYVVEVTADGETLADGLLEDPPASSEGIEELRMVSVDGPSFIAVTMQEAGDALAEAVRVQRLAAETIQGGSVSDAFEPLQQLLTLWNAISVAAWQAAALMGQDAKDIGYESDGAASSGADRISGLEAKLGELKRSITEEDWASLGDVLMYDLDEEAGNWRPFLEAIGRMAGERRERGA